MADNYSVIVGTIGQGIWRSLDRGENWERVIPPRSPFPLECKVRALAVHPKNPYTVYAGADDGFYASYDSGASWEKVSSPEQNLNIWSLTIDEENPETIFAGTRPAALYRSTDSGRVWEQLPVDVVVQSHIGTSRVTTIAIDPNDHQIIWAGVEVGGIYSSHDGGDSWIRVGEVATIRRDDVSLHPLATTGITDPDIHQILFVGGDSKRIFVSTPEEIFISSDGGESFQPMEVAKQFPAPLYIRGISIVPGDPHTVLAACGDDGLGTEGFIERSTDTGNTWQDAPLSIPANSHVWGFATHPSNPNRFYAVTLFGQIYGSEDAGQTWKKIKREVSEIRAVAWMPNSN